MADAAAIQSFSAMANFLRQVGLEGLFTVDRNGNPGGWLWNRIQAGVSDVQLGIELEQTDIFRNRFGVIGEQQKRAARGEPVYVMSPAEVMQYEKEVKQIFASAGLPATFYDQPSDFHALILRNLSPATVAERVQSSVEYVQAAPAEVRNAFRDFYGVGQGDAALAAWALDPERTLADVQRSTRTAYAAGMAQRFDIGIDRQAASRIADLDVSPAELQAKYRNIAAMDSIFTESLGEATDITQQSGIDAEFEGDADAIARINRRMGTRRSMNTAPTGGAALTQQGLTGARSA